MGKDDTIDLEGTVVEPLPNGKFVVEVTIGEKTEKIIGHLSGKMRMNFIKILPGDKVTVQLSTYDFTKGRITYRHSGKKPSAIGKHEKEPTVDLEESNLDPKNTTENYES